MSDPLQDKTVELTVAEFRKNVKAALDYAVQGGVVIIDRMGQRFMLNHIPRGTDVQFAKAGDKVFVANGVDPVKKIDLTKKNKSVPQAETNEFTEALDASEQPCCRKKAPCKHWHYEEGQWINSLSGRTREADE